MTNPAGPRIIIQRMESKEGGKTKKWHTSSSTNLVILLGKYYDRAPQTQGASEFRHWARIKDK
jgi:hypothetical protein